MFNVQNELSCKFSSSKLDCNMKSQTVLDCYAPYSQEKHSAMFNGLREQRNSQTNEFWNGKERFSSIQKNKWLLQDRYALSGNTLEID